LELLVYHAKKGLLNRSGTHRTRTVSGTDFVTRNGAVPDGIGFDDQVRNLLWIVVSTILTRARNFGTLGFRKRPAIYVHLANEQG